MWLVVVVVAVVVVLATYLTWLAGRLDRLHARMEAASASLDAQLVRRAAAALALAGQARARRLLSAADAARLEDAAGAARASGLDPDREVAENRLSRTLHETLDGRLAANPELAGLLDELDVAATKVVIARRFYGDAVRDTRELRGRRLVRWLHLAGRAQMPQYFEIDDRPPAAPPGPL
jgi:hypothetical protein